MTPIYTRPELTALLRAGSGLPECVFKIDDSVSTNEERILRSGLAKLVAKVSDDSDLAATVERLGRELLDKAVEHGYCGPDDDDPSTTGSANFDQESPIERTVTMSFDGQWHTGSVRPDGSVRQELVTREEALC